MAAIEATPIESTPRNRRRPACGVASPPYRSGAPAAVIVRRVAAAVFAGLVGLAVAQPHVAAEGPYRLRASVVSSLDIPASMAREYGIERSPLHGVLDVVLLRRNGEALKTLPAEVDARVTNLLGATHSLAIRPARSDGWVSYVTGFRHAPAEVLEFVIEARPVGGGPTLKLRFQERMHLRQGGS